MQLIFKNKTNFELHRFYAKSSTKYEASKDIEQMQNLLKDIRIAGDHTNPIVKSSVEKAEQFITKYKKELLNDLKGTLGLKSNASLESFGQKLNVDTYEMCKFTYNIASDEYRFPSPSLKTVGVFNGVDKDYTMENMKVSHGEKMKFICRDLGGKPGTMAWRFQIPNDEGNDNIIINKLKVMALSSKTQGSSITWEINGGVASTDQPTVVKADLLGSPSIIDFSSNVKGWKWFQITVVLDPGNANDDASNAQLFRARNEDKESSQFSLWVELVSDTNNLDANFVVDKEKLKDLINKCDLCLGSKANRNQLLLYAKETLLTTA